MPAVAINGSRIHYEERGDGVPILCVHGCSSSAKAWEEALPVLGGLGRAIAYDRRGCTRSERPVPFTRISVREHADDAAALLGALEATPAIVIGRSYGGEVATDLALRYPELVRALVLLEGVPVELVPAAARWTRELRDRVNAATATAGVDAAAETLIDGVLGDGAWDTLPIPLRDMLTANGPAILAELNGEWLGVEADDLAAIQQPVLLVGAADSPRELREPNEAMAGALPNARTAIVDGNHLIDPAGSAVLEFIAEVRVGRSPSAAA